MPRATARPRTSRDPRWALALLLIVVAALLAFGSTFGFEFVRWRDPELVIRNPGLRPVSAASIERFWSAPYQGEYVPVAYTAWGLLAPAARPGPSGEVAPAPYHAANVIVHLVAAVILFHVILVLLGVRPAARAAEPDPTPRRHVAAAVAGALLFAVHPLQVESVAWVSGLRVLLAGCFGLGALFHLLVHAGRHWPPADRSAFCAATGVPRAFLFARAAPHEWAGLVLLALALLASPLAIALPLVAAALLPLVPGMSPRAWARAVVPWLVLAIPVAWIAFRLQEPPASGVSPLGRLIVAGDAITFYLGKLLAPIRLSPLYNRAPAIVVAHDHIVRGAVLPLVFGACFAFLAWRGRVSLVWFFAGFVAALLPVLGLVPFTYQAQSTVADHYAYLAVAVAGAALSFALVAAVRRFGAGVARTLAAATALALLVLVALTHAQTTHWRTSADLFRHVLAGNPRSLVALMELGRSYAGAGQYREAFDQFERAAAVAPRDAVIPFELGNLNARAGRLAEAVTYYRRSIELDPNAAQVHNNLGTTYARTDDLVSATHEFAEAVRLDPAMAEAHNNLGQALAMQGRMPEAIEHFKRAVELQPGLAAARANLEQAEQALRQAR